MEFARCTKTKLVSDWCSESHGRLSRSATEAIVAACAHSGNQSMLYLGHFASWLPLMCATAQVCNYSQRHSARKHTTPDALQRCLAGQGLIEVHWGSERWITPARPTAPH